MIGKTFETKEQALEAFESAINNLKKYKRAYPFGDSFYKNLKKSYPHSGFPEKFKNAYSLESAGFFALYVANGMEDVKLVSGRLENLSYGQQNLPFYHTWIEKELESNGIKFEFVYDVATKNIVEKENFYEKLGAKPERIYSSADLQDKNLFIKLKEDFVVDDAIVQKMFPDIKTRDEI